MSFQPTQISGCKLWLDGIDSTNFTFSSVTTTISSWNDKSGNAYNATAFNSPSFANSAVNFAGTAYFNGTTSIASGALLTTSFCVVTTPSAYNAQTNRILSATSGTSNDFNSPTGFLYAAVGPTGAASAYRSLICQPVTTVPVNTRFMATTIYNPGGNFNHSINGNYPSGNSNSYATASNSSNTNAFTTYYLGVTWAGSVNTGQSWKGLMHEILIYNRTLTQSEYQTVEGYLAWKWGLESSLPTTHPYYAYSPLSFILDYSQLNLVNTTFNSGQIVLPSTFTVPGRNLIFKDSTGAFSTNTLSFTVNNANQRIESALTSTINATRLGWQNMVAGNDNNWYNIGGTVINTINTSTINYTNISTPFISTGNLFTSSIGFVDQTWANSTNSLYVQSTFMFYQFGAQSTIISGTRQSFGGTFISLQKPFLPNQISGLQLWLDAADENTFKLSGNSVTQWNDKSGNNRNATGNTGTGTFANNIINGLPCVQITPTGNMAATVAAGTFSSGFSIFVMFQKTGATSANGDTVLGRSSNNIPAPWDALTTNTVTSRLVGNGPTGWWNLSSAGQTIFRRTTPTIWSANVSSSTPQTWLETINGTASNYTLTNSNNTPSYGDVAAKVWIGTRADGFTTMTGNIGEIVCYNGVITTSQRQQVEGYLAWKWGLVDTLPATHPYKSSPP